MGKVIRTQEIGSLRKPPKLMEMWKSYLNKKITFDELLPEIRRVSVENIKKLEEIGLTYVYDGEMHRWEMYYHPVTNIYGFELVGQVRVMENRYFVKAAVRKPIKFLKNYYLDEFLFIKKIAKTIVKIPVTGPYTIADWTFNEYYVEKWFKTLDDMKIIRFNAKRDLVYDLAEKVINPILKELASNGAERIQIDEPAATTHPSEMGVFVDGFNLAVDGVDATVTVHICYSDYSILTPYILEMKTKHFALEFANRDSWKLGTSDKDRPGYSYLRELYIEYGYDGEIGLGVIDVHTDAIESPELIRDRILYAAKFVDPEKIVVNPDCGLRTRRREIAFKKLENMVKGVELAEKELGLL